MKTFDLEAFRTMFPYFSKQDASIALDAVGGTQVPYTVISATGEHLINRNCVILIGSQNNER